MQELIRELRQRINMWNPSEDDGGIFFELNQLFIAVRDRIPPELTSKLKKFTHLHALLRRPKESPLGEFERELGQILRPRYRVWEIKNHSELLKEWIGKQDLSSIEVVKATLDILCESLSFIRDSLSEVENKDLVFGVWNSGNTGTEYRISDRIRGQGKEKNLNLFKEV